MKQIYILLFTAFLGLNQAYAEACPYAGTPSAGGQIINFNYASGTSLCNNRPTTIMVNGVSTYQLDAASCSEIVSVYVLNSGPAVVGQNFVVTSGFDTTCSYSGGTLPVDDFEVLKEQFKVTPNPLVSGNEIKLAFGSNMSLKIEVYNITGKLMLKTNTSNESFKTINLSRFSNGLYMVKIASESASITKKIVVMK